MEKKKSVYLGYGGAMLALIAVLWSSRSLVLEYTQSFPVISEFYTLLVIGLVLFAAAAGFFMLLRNKKPSIAFCSAVILFVMGLCYMVIIPPFSSPDEKAHYMTSYVLSNQLLGEEAFSENGRVMVRECDLFSATGELEDMYLADEPMELGKHSYQYVADHIFAPAGSTAMVESDYDEDVFLSNMLGRLPQALGLTAARVLGMNYLMSLFMGRLFGLVFFAAVFYFAVRLMPRGKMVLAAIGLFPMTVAQAASFSYDVLILSLCFLFIAYTFRLKYQEGTITTAQAVKMVLLLVAFTPWKLTYALMAFLCLILPMDKFKSKKAYYLCAASAVIAVAAAVLWVNVGSMGSMLSGADPSLDHSDVAAYTFPYLLTHPLETLQLLIHTFWYQSEYYLQTMLGQFLGVIDPSLEIRDYTIAGFGLIALFSGILVRGEEPLYDKRDKIVCGILTVVMVIVVEISMAIGWTPMDSDYILGVQGRYFLCVLPFALYFLQGKWMKLDKNMDYPMLFAAVILHATALARIVERVSFR